jgi:prefoldin alpha subunit
MAEEENKQQEMMFKLQMFDQQMKQMQQQLEAVEQGIMEMTTLNNGLSELVGKKGKEIYAPIGRGIFAKAKLESEELNVDVGGGNMVKKSIPDTKKIIDDQLGKLAEVKKELEGGMEKMGQEFTTLVQEAQGAQGHVHDENCEHGEAKEKKEEKPIKGKKIDELV